MPLSRNDREDGSVTVNTGDRLTIENIGEFRQLLLEALQQSQEVALQFEPGVEADLTTLQAICAACKAAARDRKALYFEGALPDSLLELVQTTGLERHALCKHNNDSPCIWFGGKG